MCIVQWRYSGISSPPFHYCVQTKSGGDADERVTPFVRIEWHNHTNSENVHSLDSIDINPNWMRPSNCLKISLYPFKNFSTFDFLICYAIHVNSFSSWHTILLEFQKLWHGMSVFQLKMSCYSKSTIFPWFMLDSHFLIDFCAFNSISHYNLLYWFKINQCKVVRDDLSHTSTAVCCEI